MDDSIAKALAARIKQAREHAKLNQTELAVACGWKNGSRIGNYEQGKREPSLTDLTNIAKATGVNYAWLVAGAPPMLDLAVRDDAEIFDARGRRIVAITPEEAAQLETIRAMPEEVRARFQALGDAVAKSPTSVPGSS